MHLINVQLQTCHRLLHAMLNAYQSRFCRPYIPFINLTIIWNIISIPSFADHFVRSGSQFWIVVQHSIPINAICRDRHKDAKPHGSS